MLVGVSGFLSSMWGVTKVDREDEKKGNPCLSKTQINKDEHTHMSAATRALTQLTQPGVSVCYSLKRWHAQAATSALPS